MNRVLIISIIITIIIIFIAAGFIMVNLKDDQDNLPGESYNLIVTVNGADVRLDWEYFDEENSEITGFHVYRSDISGSFTDSVFMTVIVPYGNYTYRAQSLSFTESINGTYYFMVKAWNSVGEGEASNEAVANITAN